MKRSLRLVALLGVFLFAAPAAAMAQGAALLQKPITAGHCAKLATPNLVQDAGFTCTSPTGSGVPVLATSPTIATPTISSPTISSPTITGGTLSSPTLTTPTVTSPTITGPTLTGGTINNTPIGQTTPGAGAFTVVSGSVTATGATTSRTLADHFADGPTVKDRGAALDGSTDDATAINAMLTANKVAVFPCTPNLTVIVGSTLSIPSNGGLKACSLGVTIKAKAGFNGDIIANATGNPASLAARDAGLTFENITIDGNKANVTSTYCFDLRAVDGASFRNVRCINPTGDGLYLGAATGSQSICGADIKGDIRVEGAARNGVSGICFEDVNLKIYAVSASLNCLDVEGNDATNYQRNSFFQVLGESCGVNGAYTSGGCINITPAEPSSSYTYNLTVQFVCNGGYGNANGAGVGWRAAQNLKLSGQVYGFNGNAFKGGPSATNPSTVTFDVDSINATAAGFAGNEVTGAKYYGRIRVVSAGGKAFDMSHMRGGELTVSSTGAAQQGLVMGDVQDVIWHADIQGSTSHNVWVTSNGGLPSTGNRFPELRATGAGSFGQGFVEDGSGNNNIVTNGRISGNGAGQVSIVGSTSRVDLEPIKATATWDPPSVASGVTTTTTVTVTGAAVGDQVRVSFSNSLAGVTMSGYVSSSNTVTVVETNNTGGAVDLASGTVQVLDQKVY